MNRKSVLTFAFLAMVVATIAPAAAPPTAKPEPADPKELLRQADELWHLKQDYNGALAAFNRAVAADPENAETRLHRAGFFEIVAELVIKEEKTKLEQLARDDYKWIANNQPDSRSAGVARDGLTRMSGTTLLEQKSANCPPEAVQAHNRAESLYGAQH